MTAPGKVHFYHVSTLKARVVSAHEKLLKSLHNGPPPASSLPPSLPYTRVTSGFLSFLGAKCLVSLFFPHKTEAEPASGFSLPPENLKNRSRGGQRQSKAARAARAATARGSKILGGASGDAAQAGLRGVKIIVRSAGLGSFFVSCFFRGGGGGGGVELFCFCFVLGVVLFCCVICLFVCGLLCLGCCVLLGVGVFGC